MSKKISPDPRSIAPDAQQTSLTTSASFGQEHTPSSPSDKPDRWFVYDGGSDALEKQWRGVELRILHDNGAIAQCQGSNGQYYGSVPVYSLREVRRAPVQTQTEAIAPTATTDPHPVLDRATQQRQPAPSSKVRRGNSTATARQESIAQPTFF